MLRIVPQVGSADEPNVLYALIWNWRYQNNRHLVGHRGWMFGIVQNLADIHI